MLETSPKHVVCGCIVMNDEYTHLYCHCETGAVAYENDVDGSTMQVGEVSIINPLEIRNIENFGKQLLEGKYAGAKGLIFKNTGEVIAIIDDYSAEIRTLATIGSHSDKKIEIDLNQEYDGEAYYDSE